MRRWVARSLCLSLLAWWAVADANVIGFGRGTTGGAGQTVVTVTTCADSSSSPPAGSLRALVAGNQPNRYVKFSADCRKAIGTAIQLSGAKITIDGDNVTIACWDSPGRRIDVENQSVNFRGSNFAYYGCGSLKAVSEGIDAWQHAPRSSSTSQQGGVAFRTSARLQGDETMSVSGVTGGPPDERRNFSFLYNLYLDPQLPTHDTNVIVGDAGSCPQHLTFFGNLLAKANRRNPWVGCRNSTVGNPANVMVDFRNNVLFDISDPSGGVTGTNDGARLWMRASVNVVRNWIKAWDSATDAGRKRSILICDGVAYGTADGGSSTTLIDNDVDFVSLGVQPGMGLSIQNKNTYSTNITAVTATQLTFTALNSGMAQSGDTYMVHRHAESTVACRPAGGQNDTRTFLAHVSGNRYYGPHDANLTAYLNGKSQLASPNSVPTANQLPGIDPCSSAWLTYLFAGSPQRDSTEAAVFAELRTALNNDRCSALPMWLGAF